MRHLHIILMLAGVSLAGCGGPLASATDAVRAEVKDPDAEVVALREHWTPVYQKVVCGRVEVGIEQRRFVAPLTSGGDASSAMVEGAKAGEKEAFGDVIWRPMCGF
jgi:hypothetical protein